MVNRPLETLARRVPLGRRIFLTVILYAIAVGSLGFASWRMVDLVIDYRARVNEQQNRAEKISDLAKKTARFQAQVRSLLDQSDQGDIQGVEELSIDLLKDINGLNIPDELAIIQQDKLRLATLQYYGQFGYARHANIELRETYIEISKNSASVTGLIRILGHPIKTSMDTAASLALSAAVRRTEEAFAHALIEMNAYYFSGDKVKATKALAQLGMMENTVPILAFLTTEPMLKSAVTAITKRTKTLIEKVSSLETMFRHRKLLMETDLNQSQLVMTGAIDSLIFQMRETQKISAENLESEMRDTLSTILMMTGGLMLIGLLANFVIVGSIRRPILQLQKVMEDLSGGDWDRVVPGRQARDEIGAMARTLDVFKHNTVRMHALETEKREELAKEKAETENALSQLDGAHKKISILAEKLSNENLRLGAELDVSRKLQEMILPRKEELIAIDGLDITTFMQPADEIGGDYFDVLKQGNGKVHIGIGDVTGHGLESGVVMLMTQSMMRTLTRSDNLDLPDMLNSLNASLFGNLQRIGGDKNLTLSLAEYQPSRKDLKEGGTLRIVGQHESVLIIRANGELEEIDTLYLGMTIGLVDDVREFTDEAVIILSPGDSVVLYTDGITEAADSEGSLYGIDRLKHICVSHHEETSQKINDAVISDVLHYTNGQDLYDDISLVVLKQE